MSAEPHSLPAAHPHPVPGMLEQIHEDTVTEWHAGLPSGLEEPLCRLYGNIHSTLAHLRIYGGIEAITHTYIERCPGRATAIFLVRVEGRRLRVLNEGMVLDAATLERFAAEAFARFGKVDAIFFHAVRAQPQRLSYPLQRAVCTAEMPLALPADADAYHASLGKNLRRNLRRYMDRLLQRFPSFQFEVREGDGIAESDARAVLALNRARIAGKQQDYSIAAEEEKIIALLHRCGMAGIGRIDGRVCCGALGYRVGDHYFFKIIGHDPQYNPWSLGILCCYLNIRACLERGCREYNFMWNEYEYKLAFGARRRELERLVVYRSRWWQAANAGVACKLALEGWHYRAGVLMEREGGVEQLPPLSRAAFHLLRGVRRLKQALLPRR